LTKIHLSGDQCENSTELIYLQNRLNQALKAACDAEKYSGEIRALQDINWISASKASTIENLKAHAPIFFHHFFHSKPQFSG
jgi:hypothetical protein